MIRSFVLLLLLAGPAAAQERIRVISGEHPGFSRLVLTPPRALDWRIDPEEGGYRLVLDGRVGFDLSEIFRRIPRARLLAVEPAGPGALRLRTAPDVPADGFIAEDRRSIVIDLGDPTPGSLPAPVSVSATAAEGARLYRPLLPPLADVGIFWRDRPLPAPAAAADTEGGGGGQRSAASGPAPEAIVVSPASAADQTPRARPEERAQAVEKELLDQLARAAVQGLITIDPSALPKLPGAEPLPAVLPDVTSALDARAAPVAAETSMDRALGRPARPEVSPQAHACLADDAIDVAAWSDDRPYVEQLADHRTEVMADLDAVDPAKILAMARFQIAQGFGAEARALLAGYPQAGTPLVRGLLEQMARIVDGAAPAEGPLSDQAGCAGLVAPWAALAGQGDPRDLAPRGAILRGLSGLPLGLRRQIAPGLAERFLSSGDAEAARIIRDALYRAPGTAGAAAEMLAARVEAGDGEQAAAEGRLATLSRGEEPLSGAALVALIDQRLSAGEPVAPGDIALAQARAFAARGTADGIALRQAALRALVAGGRIDEAFAERDIARDEAPPASWSTLDHGLVAAIAAQPDEVAFLTAAFRALPQIEALPASDPLRPAIAERLRAAGFPDRATAIEGPAAAEAAAPPPVAADAAPDAPASAAPPAALPPAAAPSLREGRDALAASRSTREAIAAALGQTAAQAGGVQQTATNSP
ncbi:hypothetical protein V8J36_18190 [Frigidibacter sp. MR17.14]|uniref:hypothetical protein n=1 Tax=Frigidibacter sp. MR17.14 TaxID=3126509 RepID=UPI0030130961